MFAALLQTLREECETVIRSVRTNELLRQRLAAPIPAAGEDLLADVRLLAPDFVQWRVYDHCAALTRFYAAYECFVFKLIENWVVMLPDVYLHYSDLPDRVKTNHRRGIGQILIHLADGAFQKKHSETVVVSAASDGPLGRAPYTLLPSAFLAGNPNLRFETLLSLLSKVGIQGAKEWITHHPGVREYLETERADEVTVEKELDTFIEIRNTAAHDSVGQILAIEEIERVGKFLVALGLSVAELVTRALLGRRLEMRQATEVGVVIHKWKDNISGVEAGECTLAVNDELFAYGETVCCRVSVLSMQVEHVNRQRIDATAGLHVGMRLTRALQVGTKLVRFLGSPAIQAPVAPPPDEPRVIERAPEVPPADVNPN